MSMSHFRDAESLEKILLALEDAPADESGMKGWHLRWREPLRRILSKTEFETFDSVRERTFQEDQLAFSRLLRRAIQLREEMLVHGVYERRPYETRDENLESFARNWRRIQPKLLLFLGAGASMGARNAAGRPLPTASELRDLIWQELCAPEPAGDDLDFAPAAHLSLQEVAARAEVMAGRGALEAFVEGLFEGAKPLWHHAVLPLLAPRALLTTNYDDLIELGWALHEGSDSYEPCVPVYSTEEGGSQRLRGVPVFKPHGSVARSSAKIGQGGLVLTQFDYFEMISSNQSLVDSFLNQLKEHCVLFVGYGLMDMDLGSYLWKLRKEDRANHWYAVFPCDEPEVRRMYEEHLGVRVVNRRFHEFLAELSEKVEGLIPEAWGFERIPRLREQVVIG